MKRISVIESAEELAGLCRNRTVPTPEGYPSPARLPDGAKLLINQAGQVTVVAEGYINDPIHVVDLIRVVALGYGVQVEQG